MLVSSQGFSTPKRGNVVSEYEDAYFPELACQRQSLSEFRCAVSDGASESAFSREWARLLVRRFHSQRISLGLLQKCWLRKVTRKPVPWYLEEKIRRGAHATLVGLSIQDLETAKKGGGSWKATAVGDSCLFHVRKDKLLTVTPLSKSEEFNNHPHLVSTDSTNAFGINASHVKVISGEWLPNDVFYLLTDAIAEWALAQQEAGKPPWALFRKLGRRSNAKAAQQTFEKLVTKLRKTGGLHNDDTTLLRIEVA
jgi:serine/threonine protein phosphatase PrpC